jgi:hypothetical protein
MTLPKPLTKLAVKLTSVVVKKIPSMVATNVSQKVVTSLSKSLPKSFSKNVVDFPLAITTVGKRYCLAVNTKRENVLKVVNHLADIYTIISNKEIPFVEYIFTKPNWSSFKFFIFNFTSATNPYGHSAIRYSLPKGNTVKDKLLEKCESTDVVVNVSSSKLVNFFDSEKYLFTNTICDGNQQGGIYRMCLI